MASANSNDLFMVMPGRDKFRAPFFHADGLDGVGHAKLFKKRQIRREQRFADVKTRMVRLFQQGHAVATLGQQRRRSRAGGPTTDYQYVAARIMGGGGCVGSAHHLIRLFSSSAKIVAHCSSQTMDSTLSRPYGNGSYDLKFDHSGWLPNPAAAALSHHAIRVRYRV